VIFPDRANGSLGYRSDPRLVSMLEAMIDQQTRGDPESPLRWRCKGRVQTKFHGEWNYVIKPCHVRERY
jgi:hypothetical protein